MNTQLISVVYGDAIRVDFTETAWFNATTVAKQFNKLPHEWLRLDSTKGYIESLLKFHLRENPVNDKNQLVKTKTGKAENGGGTWFHPKLAVAFARWLSVDFAVWCDFQIEKILRDRQTKPEQAPLLTFATKEQREPLIKAVRQFVAVATQKGRSITYQQAHDTVNLKMGVRHVEELTVEQIPDALKIVGSMLERVVFEGEYIARDDAPHFVPVYVNNQQKQELYDMAGFASTWCHHSGGATWILNGLRAVLGVSTMDDIEVGQLDFAKAHIKQKEQECQAFCYLINEIRERFYKEVLSGGAPFLGEVKRKWTAEYMQKLPPKVDWRDIIDRLSK